jgi:hypothetical protein
MPYLVNIIESERGWGRRVDSERIFATRAAAEKFIAEYNSQNTASSAPDWYMQAEFEGETTRKVTEKPKRKPRKHKTQSAPGVAIQNLEF